MEGILAFTICESVDIWGTLKTFAKAQWHTFLNNLGDAKKLDYFDQGEMAATILVNLVLFVITLLDLAELAAQVGKAVGPELTAAKRAAGELSNLTKSGAGKVAEAVVNTLGRRGKKVEGILSENESLPALSESNAIAQQHASDIVKDDEKVVVSLPIPQGFSEE